MERDHGTDDDVGEFFAEFAIVDALQVESRDLSERDARRAVERWGVARCRDVMEHTDLIAKDKKIRLTWRHAFFHCLENNLKIDSRVAAARAEAAAKAQREADHAELDRLANEARAKQAAKQASDRATWDALSDADRRRLLAEAIAQMPEARAKFVRDRPIDNPGVRAAILERLEATRTHE